MQKNRQKIISLSFFILALSLGTLGFHHKADAAEYTVSNYHDDDPFTSTCPFEAVSCSLRNTIASLPPITPENPVNTVRLKDGHYQIQCRPRVTAEGGYVGGVITVENNVNIIGEGSDKTFIECADETTDGERFFNIKDSVNAMEINQLTLGGANPRSRLGGGIVNTGSLALKGVELRNNTSTIGGAIVNEGTLNISLSRLYGNRALAEASPAPGSVSGLGGAIFQKSGSLRVASSTFDHNSADREGGALATVTDLSSVATTINLTNATFSKNAAGVLVPSAGGAMYFKHAGAVVSLLNTTVAHNTASGQGGGIAAALTSKLNFQNTLIAQNHAEMTGQECVGALITLGHNLVRDTDDCTIRNVSGVDLHDILGTRASPINDGTSAALDGVGGPTPTHALAFGSMAVNAGDNSVCPDLDQRSLAREKSLTNPCDIGAYEQIMIEGESSLVSLHEGEMVAFKVIRRGGTNAPMSVHFETRDVSASAAAGDYLSNTGGLTFAADQAYAEVKIVALADAVLEGDETFMLFLSDATGGGMTPPNGIKIIIQDASSGAAGSSGEIPGGVSGSTGGDGVTSIFGLGGTSGSGVSSVSSMLSGGVSGKGAVGSGSSGSGGVPELTSVFGLGGVSGSGVSSVSSMSSGGISGKGVVGSGASGTAGGPVGIVVLPMGEAGIAGGSAGSGGRSIPVTSIIDTLPVIVALPPAGGSSGSAGVSGIAGSTAVSGVAGKDGLSGIAGSSGSAGSDFNTGVAGVSGSAGGGAGVAGKTVSGIAGMNGQAGSSGSAGVAGSGLTAVQNRSVGGSGGANANTGLTAVQNRSVAGVSGSGGVAGSGLTAVQNRSTGGSGGVNDGGLTAVQNRSVAAGVNGAAGSSGSAGTAGSGVTAVQNLGSAGISGVNSNQAMPIQPNQTTINQQVSSPTPPSQPQVTPYAAGGGFSCTLFPEN